MTNVFYLRDVGL